MYVVVSDSHDFLAQQYPGNHYGYRACGDHMSHMASIVPLRDLSFAVKLKVWVVARGGKLRKLHALKSFCYASIEMEYFLAEPVSIGEKGKGLPEN